MTDDLEQVATFEDETSAEILAGLLRSEGIPVVVRLISPLPGLIDAVKVFVPASLAHRARSFMKSSVVSDAELTFAATGELGQDDD